MILRRKLNDYHLFSALIVVYLCMTSLSWIRVHHYADLYPRMEAWFHPGLHNNNNERLMVTAFESNVHMTSLAVEKLTMRNMEPTTQLETEMQSTPSKYSRFAYAFVIGGCNPEQPSYRYYLYNILISTNILREEGSTSDVVAFIQMAWASNATRLPSYDLQLLRTMNIRVRYIPKTQNETFYRICLDKFRILGLTEYERVMFLDGDVMPLTNLDYLFDLSVNRTLRENVVVRGSTEPANAGLFMLQPNYTHLQEINEIVTRREREARKLRFPHFNETVGWGHIIQPGDEWFELERPGRRNWTFYSASSDQGLLYYWVKYVRKSVSIFVPEPKKPSIEHWYQDSNGKLVKQVVKNPLASNPSRFFPHRKFPPDNHYIHFTGARKPWLTDLDNENRTRFGPGFDESHRFWRGQLATLAATFGLQINYTNWTMASNRPSLGMKPGKYEIPISQVNLLEKEYI